MTENKSTKILLFDDSTLSPPSVRLVGSMRRRTPVKEILARKIKDSGLTVPEICRRADAKGYQVSVSAIKFILNGSTKNPQVFTLEAIAVGMDLAPLAFLAEILGDRMEDPSFKSSQFGVLSEMYNKEMTQAQRAKADPFIDGLMLQMKHIKGQSK